ncbi:MAG TPA: hypothetical protein VIE65_09185 [Methylobacter sp.]|jgi:hypothetical protein
MNLRLLNSIVFLALSGCASAQLNYNAIDLASSSVNLIASQILTNLGKFRANPYAIPSQVSIPSGSASTTNTITPTFGGPLGASATLSAANLLAAPLFEAKTHSHTTPNGTVGLTVGDQWSQNWTLAPLEDPDQLRRLRALYRFGAGNTDKKQLACEYPLVQLAQGAGAPSQSDAKQPSSGSSYEYASYITSACAPITIGTPDPAFLKPPACVICDYDADKPGVPSPSTQQIVLTGDLNKETNIIQKIQLNKGAPNISSLLKLVGSQISGLCIPVSTKIASVNSDSEIQLDQQPTCTQNGVRLNAASPQPVSSVQPPRHKLTVNKFLNNEWLLFSENGVTPAEEAQYLGNYAGQDLYLSLRHAQEYSDFVLFVLEATLQSTSTSGGGGGGKGTPQKGGAPAAVQLPASATILLQ